MEILDVFATDPRGRQIAWNEERFTYVLSKHEESAELITKELVKLAIERPAHGFIYASNSDPQCHIYYRKLRNWPAEIKVVVEFTSDDKPGNIKTFHLCSSRPRDEKTIWPKLNP